MWSTSDLIVAPATPPGDGARAIVRLAGAGLQALLERLVAPEPPGFALPGGGPRAVRARLAVDGLGHDWGAVPVEVLQWPGPGGPVGGPVAELQLPCSAPLVAAVVAEACRHGARIAVGGEFTLRAFLAGRLDLLQAEAVLAVVEARTPAELSSALDRMAGGAGRRLEATRTDLLDLLADVEAAIDFADETTPDAVPTADAAAWRDAGARLELVRSAVDAAAEGLASRDASAAVGLPRVVLAGPPNVGKSSLFNALVGRDAALVADAAGTTRDWIEARLDDAAARWACTLVDLAGMADDDRPPADAGVAAAADAAARGQVARADVVVVCHDASAARPPVAVPAGTPRIDVRTRSDRGCSGPVDALATSAVTGAGIAALRQAIGTAVVALPPRDAPATARLAEGLGRARHEMRLAAADIDRAASGGGLDEAVVAGRLRAAADALSAVTGADLGGDLLDRIFARHCVGK